MHNTIVDVKMHSEKYRLTQLFETWHVTRILVGIPQTYLNLFLQRKLYGITARVFGRRGDKSSRRFDAEQVFGIGLAWMLSKSGLRAEVIRQIFCEIAGTEIASAREAAGVLCNAGLRYLVVLRSVPIPGEDCAETACLEIELTDWQDDVTQILSKNTDASAFVFNVREVFDRIEAGIKLIWSRTKEGSENVPLQTR